MLPDALLQKFLLEVPQAFGYDLRDNLLLDALRILSNESKTLQDFSNQPVTPALKEEKDRIINNILQIEQAVREKEKSWKLVLDIPMQNGKHATPIVQFCSGAPDLTNIIGGVSAEQKKEKSL